MITLTNLSKRYYIVPSGKNGFRRSFREELKGLFSNGQQKEPLWALKDVSFSIEKGETVGIIGSNGSGKSTLLKILAGITLPTDGVARLKGKVASLLQIGLGFHPDLTGRENIFLNGAILGFKKNLIEKELDSIIGFSGIGKFIDTPIKYYSSGMHVRLAFSIATAKLLEPDILLVDEVLSVGDKDFKKKSFARMEELAKKDNTTILLVSHNLDFIKKLCPRCIWLEKGKVQRIGPCSQVIAAYTSRS